MFASFTMMRSRRAIRLPAGSFASLLTLSVMLAALPLHAASCTWAVSSGDWSLASNWSGGVPTSLATAYIINGGTAAITLPGATCGYLYLGDPNSANSGTVQMSSGNLVLSYIEYLGNIGAGTFTQSGGTNLISSTLGKLYIGFNSASSGNYNLSGSGLLSVRNEYVGYAGAGTFSQSGGTNAASSSLGKLYLGYSAASNGTYILCGSGVLSAPAQYVGNSGIGTFSQSGGTNSSTTLFLGYHPGSSGIYNLSGSGILSTQSGYVGYSGTGTFTQSGGAATISNSLFLGYSGGSGTYSLSGAGQLSASAEYVGGAGAIAALFQQTGGTNTNSIFSIGADGHYLLGGGLLQINGLFSNAGTLDGGNAAGAMSIEGSSIVDFSQGNLVNTASMSLSVGPDSLVILPAGSNSSTLFGSYVCSGLTHTVGTALMVGPNQGFGGSGSIHDPVTCQGWTTASPGGSIYLDGGLNVAGTGAVNLGGGDLTTNDQASGMTGGSVTAENHYVGNPGIAAFTQSGGESTISNNLYLGYNSSDIGSYALSGSGQISAVSQYVGYSGSGSFTQSGGTNTVLSTLYVGYNSGSSGTYALTGTGQLIVNPGGEIRVGADSGTGRFEWFADGLTAPALTLGADGTLAMGFDFDATALASGAFFHGTTVSGLNAGTLEVTNNATATQAGSVGLNVLRVGTNSGNGAYNLSGGMLAATSEYVGDTAAGTLTQSGGANALSDTLWLGNGPGSSGGYSLSSTAQLSCASLYVGYSGMGSFTQSGGTNTISNALYLGYNPGGSGAYTLSGSGQLSASYQGIGYSGTGIFTQSEETSASCGELHLGSVLGGSGTYSLGGGQLSTGPLFIGESGAGVFLQSGGTNSCADLHLGSGSSGSGTYCLNDGQLVSIGAEYLGESGTGTFTQTGGTHTAWYFYLGCNPGSNGTYSLGGTGCLSAGYEVVSNAAGAVALFQQTGGSNSTTTLSIGAQGRYLLGGGTLQIGGYAFPNFVNAGTLDGGNAASVLTFGGSMVIDFSQGSLVNTASTSLIVGPGSLVIVSSGCDLSNAFGSFSNAGIMHTAGTLLTVGTGQGFSGSATINDPVVCQGWIGAWPDDLSLNGGLSISGTGAVNLGWGGVTTDDSFSGMTGGTLSGYSHTIGYSGTGVFSQTGGTNSCLYFSLGYNPGSSGTYLLSGSGTILANGQIVGYNGTGTFVQSGGTNTIFVEYGGELDLGYNIGSNGTYILGGAGKPSLSAINEYVGYSGSGSFVQTGGTNTMSGTLYIGYNLGSGGTYGLNGSGQLDVWLIAKNLQDSC